MASLVVADSGIFIKLVLEEPFSEQADQLIRQWSQQTTQVAAPVLFQYEIVAVIRKHVYRKLLTAEEAAAKRDMLLTIAQTIRFEVDEKLLRRAYALAEQFNRPTTYDSQYLALAERLGCDFWTADERLFNAVRQDLNWVHWLGNMPAGIQQPPP